MHVHTVRRRARQRLCWAIGLGDAGSPAGAELDNEIGVAVIGLAMERSRYRCSEAVMPLQRTLSGNPANDAAREIQQKEAQRGLRAASDPGSLRRAIVEAEKFEGLATDIASASAQLTALEGRVEERVRQATSARDLHAVVALLHEVDGWQLQAGGRGPAASWVARLNTTAASILDEESGAQAEPE